MQTPVRHVIITKVYVTKVYVTLFALLLLKAFVKVKSLNGWQHVTFFTPCFNMPITPI